MTAKRKLSITLDADLVTELGTTDEALSKQVNDAVRDAIDRRRRQRLLAELCDELEARHGRIPDRLIAKYEALLS